MVEGRKAPRSPDERPGIDNLRRIGKDFHSRPHGQDLRGGRDHPAQTRGITSEASPKAAKTSTGISPRGFPPKPPDVASRQAESTDPWEARNPVSDSTGSRYNPRRDEPLRGTRDPANGVDRRCSDGLSEPGSAVASRFGRTIRTSGGTEVDVRTQNGSSEPATAIRRTGVCREARHRRRTHVRSRDANIPAGQIFAGAEHAGIAFSLSIGGVPATVGYGGLAPNYVGLYQFNVTVPAVRPGNAGLKFGNELPEHRRSISQPGNEQRQTIMENH